MKFFADTAEIAEIKELAATGLLDGVTTNPSLIMKSGRDFMEVTREICGITSGPVSAEVVALDHEGMMREAEVLRKIADNVCIKVPLTIDGLIETLVPEVGGALRVAREPLIGQVLAALTGVDLDRVARGFAAEVDSAIWREIGVEEAAIRADPVATRDPLLTAALKVV